MAEGESRVGVVGSGHLKLADIGCTRDIPLGYCINIFTKTTVVYMVLSVYHISPAK